MSQLKLPTTPGESTEGKIEILNYQRLEYFSKNYLLSSRSNINYEVKNQYYFYLIKIDQKKKKKKGLNNFWSLPLNGGVYFPNTNSGLGQKDAAEMMHGTRLGTMPVPSLGLRALALQLGLWHHLMNEHRLACWRTRHTPPFPRRGSEANHHQPASSLLSDDYRPLRNPVRIRQVWSKTAEPHTCSRDS